MSSTAAVATWPLRVALAARLSAHAQTSALNWGVEGVPESLPIGRLGPVFGVGAGTFTTEGSIETVQVDYWSRSVQDAEEALAKIVEAVTDTALTVTGFSTVAQPRLASYDVIPEPSEEEGQTIHHAAARFEFTLYRAA